MERGATSVSAWNWLARGVACDRTRCGASLRRNREASMNEKLLCQVRGFGRLAHLSEVRSAVRVCVSVAGSGLLARNAVRTLSI